MIRFERVSPVLPVRSVRAALAYYQRLGFEAIAYNEMIGDEPIYGFVRRETVELHLALTTNLDPTTNTSSIYLYIDDADALHAEWTGAKIDGRLTPPADTAYGLREITLCDPDGNLLRIGSEMLEVQG